MSYDANKLELYFLANMCVVLLEQSGKNRDNEDSSSTTSERSKKTDIKVMALIRYNI